MFRDGYSATLQRLVINYALKNINTLNNIIFCSFSRALFSLVVQVVVVVDKTYLLYFTIIMIGSCIT